MGLCEETLEQIRAALGDLPVGEADCTYFRHDDEFSDGHGFIVFQDSKGQYYQMHYANNEARDYRFRFMTAGSPATSVWDEDSVKRFGECVQNFIVPAIERMYREAPAE